MRDLAMAALVLAVLSFCCAGLAPVAFLMALVPLFRGTRTAVAWLALSCSLPGLLLLAYLIFIYAIPTENLPLTLQLYKYGTIDTSGDWLDLPHAQPVAADAARSPFGLEQGILLFKAEPGHAFTAEPLLDIARMNRWRFNRKLRYTPEDRKRLIGPDGELNGHWQHNAPDDVEALDRLDSLSRALTLSDKSADWIPAPATLYLLDREVSEEGASDQLLLAIDDQGQRLLIAHRHIWP